MTFEEISMIEKSFINNNLCSGCFACVSKCPKNCISMKTNAEGFWYPEILTDDCSNCKLCESCCPVLNRNIEQNLSNEAFAVINQDDKIRENSSSGGVFHSIASSVLKNDGVVFGAAFSQDFKSVEHIAIKSHAELPLLMGSKYLQSKISSAYIEAKNYLENDKSVLFSGTPCQIAGLYSFLGKDYPNLITQDIICHGVPSPLVWKKYVEYRENNAESKTKSVFFRHKKIGWKTFSLQFVFKNDKEYIEPLNADLYMKGFLSNLFLRPSCHNCSFKSENRIADITLADFWGINNINKEIDDDKGISLILVNTEKGMNLLENIKSQITFEKVDKATALKYNSAATKSPLMPPQREKFMKDFQNQSIDKSIKKHCKVKIKTKIKKFIKSVLRKLKIGG